MKEYRKNMRSIYWVLLAIGAIGTLSLYFEEWFQWSARLYFTLCACFLPVIVFSPLKYFCGVVSLRVTDKAIERVWMIFKTCTISRDGVVAFPRSVLGILCMVFSNSDLSHARTGEILCAVLKCKAIVFPYTYQITRDFPEWFE